MFVKAVKKIYNHGGYIHNFLSIFYLNFLQFFKEKSSHSIKGKFKSNKRFFKFSQNLLKRKFDECKQINNTELLYQESLMMQMSQKKH